MGKVSNLGYEIWALFEVNLFLRALCCCFDFLRMVLGELCRLVSF